jgi:hypothetical protein
VGDTFETGVAARSMSFHVACKVLKLTSVLVSHVEAIELINYDMNQATELETLVPLTGLKRLTTSLWANEDFPFHQMTNLEYVSVETYDLSIISSGKLKSLSKLRVLEMKTNDFVQFDFKPSNIKQSYQSNNVFLLYQSNNVRRIVSEVKNFFTTVFSVF